mmetsp:Transcript_29874/g.71132  ORF Transcript_29874/g.71132 Transcript_29874/m.71132 type:complete len:142 (+) Transcript_29874:136-561(+)
MCPRLHLRLRACALHNLQASQNTQSSSEVTVALMTLETALNAASMHRIPTPSTTDGMPSPSAAIASVGVIITAGTAAPAATSRGVVPRSCAAGAGPLTKARQRRATHAARATQAVISLEERAMIERVAAWFGWLRHRSALA